jgi:hypothetical protein
MNSQELRALQEAYMDVVMNEKIDDENTPLRQKSHNPSFYGKPWERLIRRKADGGGHQISKSPKNREKYQKSKEVKEDIYDIILSHLLDEGYAETPEAAEAIMVNMSEE